MKMNIKRLTVVVLALVVAIGLGYFSWDRALKASEDDGTVTASEQQQTVEQASQPVEVVVPAATEAPAETEAPAATEAPAETEAPAATEAPAEMEAPAATEAPAETEAPRDPSFDVEVKLLTGGDIYYGDKVKLQAVLTGETDANFTYQWQYNDGSGWKNVKNATRAIYEFEVTEENAVYDYRVVVTGAAK